MSQSTGSLMMVLVLSACSGNPVDPAHFDMAASPDLSSANGSIKAYSLTPFTLATNEEGTNCYYVPAEGVERYITRFVVDMNEGSHHLIVFRLDERNHTGALPPAGPAPCMQTDFPVGLDGMLPGSQQLHSEVELPRGVAMKLEKYHGLWFQSHYVNSTSRTITTQVTYRMDSVDASEVRQSAGVIFYSNFDLAVPVGRSTASRTCHAPKDLSLVTVTGHMHRHGLTFDATAGGRNIFHTDHWDEPDAAVFPAPGLAISKGTPIGWSCSYDNETGSTLVFGNSATKNEMCILGALYYPAVDGETLYDCL